MDFLMCLTASATALLTVNFFTKWPLYIRTQFAMVWIAAAIISAIAAILTTGNHKIIIRHSTVRDYYRYAGCSLLKSLIMGVIICACFAFRGSKGVNAAVALILGYDFLLTLFFIFGVRITLITAYDIYKKRLQDVQTRHRVLVLGTGDKSLAAVKRLEQSPHYNIVGFLSDSSANKGLKINEKAIYVYRDEKDLKNIVFKLSVDSILFASESDLQAYSSTLIKFCTDNNLRPLIIPSIDEVGHHGNVI